MFTYNNELYKNLSNDDFILYNQGGVIIPFNKTWKSISIRLSGGADSALLTYILCKIITENNIDCEIHAISFIRNWATRPWQNYISIQVYDKLVNMFPNIKFSRHPGFVPPSIEHGAVGGAIIPYNNNGVIKYETGEGIVMSDFDKFIAGTYNTKAAYVGITSNPPAYDTQRREMSERDLDLKKTNIHKLVEYRKKTDTWYMVPLRYIDKKWVVSQFINDGILDLYSMTRSCEGDLVLHPELAKIIPTFKDYTPGMYVPICNDCWWCWERKWAETAAGINAN